MVEMMGGEIGCRSEAEKGSTFWFTFHVLKQAKSELIPDLALLRGLRLLYVDSYLTGQSMIACLLQACEVQIDSAIDEEGALALLYASVRSESEREGGLPYHAVLISLVDGASQYDEVIRVIETEAAFSSLKVILLIPLGQRASDRVATHVTKPVRLAALIARMKTALDLEAEERVESPSEAPVSHMVQVPSRTVQDKK